MHDNNKNTDHYDNHNNDEVALQALVSSIITIGYQYVLAFALGYAANDFSTLYQIRHLGIQTGIRNKYIRDSP